MSKTRFRNSPFLPPRPRPLPSQKIQMNASECYGMPCNGGDIVRKCFSLSFRSRSSQSHPSIEVTQRTIEMEK